MATLLQDTVDFDTDVNASVFETNIRGKVIYLCIILLNCIFFCIAANVVMCIIVVNVNAQCKTEYFGVKYDPDVFLGNCNAGL